MSRKVEIEPISNGYIVRYKSNSYSDEVKAFMQLSDLLDWVSLYLQGDCKYASFKAKGER